MTEKEKIVDISSVRITIDKELFDVILEQAKSMNDVCHGVLDLEIRPSNKIFREASKIVAKKFKGEI
jgi:hypothetical protein